jgi:hypothetical protein
MPLPFTPNPSFSDDLQSFGKSSRRGRPLLFQVTDPIGRPIFSYLLALHTNPESISEKYTKSKNVVMTYGGFIEFVWPDELDTLSASHTTGGFLGPFSGLSVGSEGAGSGTGEDGLYTRAGEHGRHGTMAWERQEDLLDVFRCNGMIYNGEGQPAIRGRVMCMYDRGLYIGHFTTFEVAENDEKPWSFALSWEFKVEEVIYNFPASTNITTRPNRSGSALDPTLTSVKEYENAEIRPGIPTGFGSPQVKEPVAPTAPSPLHTNRLGGVESI